MFIILEEVSIYMKQLCHHYGWYKPITFPHWSEIFMFSTPINCLVPPFSFTVILTHSAILGLFTYLSPYFLGPGSYCHLVSKLYCSTHLTVCNVWQKDLNLTNISWSEYGTTSSSPQNILIIKWFTTIVSWRKFGRLSPNHSPNCPAQRSTPFGTRWHPP